VFDSFGNFVHELAPGLLNDPSCLHADDDGVAVIDSVALYCFDGSERPRGIFPVASLLGHSGGYVRAMAFFKEKLYLLTEAGLAIIPDPRAAVR
jgi:hypothetical protein